MGRGTGRFRGHIIPPNESMTPHNYQSINIHCTRELVAGSNADLGQYIPTAGDGLESDRDGLQAPCNRRLGVEVYVELMFFEIRWTVTTDWHMGGRSTPTNSKNIEKTLTLCPVVL